MILNETPEQIRAAELFQCFRRGWKHGTGANAADPRFTKHPREDIRIEYERGYLDGRDAAILSAAKACERLGYDARMSMLRSPAPSEPPPAPTQGEGKP